MMAHHDYFMGPQFLFSPVPTGPGNKGKPGKMGRHFKVGEFYSKYWKNQKKFYWKIEKNTGKVGEICHPVIVKTLQIWYHTLNKKKNFKNTGNCQKKKKKNAGKVRKICQSEKVGTMDDIYDSF